MKEKTHNPISMENLPADVTVLILSHLDQHSLCKLAQTSSHLYHLVTNVLYRDIFVSIGCSYPLEIKNDPRKYLTDSKDWKINWTFIFEEKLFSKLTSSIKRNPALAGKIKRFQMPEINRKRFRDAFDTMSKALKLASTYNSFEAEKEKHSHNVKIDGERDTKGLKPVEPIFLTEIEEIEHSNYLRCISSSELVTDLTDVDLDLSSAHLDGFYCLKSISCDKMTNGGLEFLDRLRLCSNVKLEPTSFSLKHISSLKDAKPASHLDFASIERKVAVRRLQRLLLEIDCLTDDGNRCQCFSKFLNDIESHAFRHDRLPELKLFSLILSTVDDWLHPSEFLAIVLTPIRNTISNFVGLKELELNLASLSLKMYSDSGMPPHALNKLNQKLIEAFFLPFYYRESSSLAEKLRILKLPDFLTSFIFYKPLFYESLLHTCRCSGCSKLLIYLSANLANVFDEFYQDMTPETLYYLVMGILLEHLQEKRQFLPMNLTSRLLESFLYEGSRSVILDALAGDEDANDPPLNSEMTNLDRLVITYIIHQLRPFVDFISNVFVELEDLLIHGIAFKRVNNKLESVFDDEEYPITLLEQQREPQDKEMNQCSTFGSLDFISL